MTERQEAAVTASLNMLLMLLRQILAKLSLIIVTQARHTEALHLLVPASAKPKSDKVEVAFETLQRPVRATKT
jgi:hypothetical protein